MGRITHLLKRRKQTRRRPIFSRAEIRRRLLAQKASARAVQVHKKAIKARRAFRPRKADRGRIIFVSTTGKRSPSKKGRKGYPVYITRTGKKWLLRQHGEKPFKPRTIGELLMPDRPNLRRAVKAFQRRRLVRIGRVRTIVKRSGSVKAGGAHDFNERISNAIAASIRAALGAQRSHRIFLVKFNVQVRLPDGSIEVISGEVPIERPDHIAIRLAGIRNFVRQKFYSFMARELAFAGYVSNGSANHIRHLAVNQDRPRNKWLDRRGEAWSGRNKGQVEILTIEWKIEQST